MKINFRGVGAEELSFKMNRVRLEPNARLDIKPQFSRQVRKVKDNDKLNFIALSMKVESTEAEPKPFDIHSVTACKVDQVTHQLGRAFRVLAPEGRFPFFPENRFSAGRANLRQNIRLGSLGAGNHPHHFRNYFSRLSKHNGGSDSYTLFRYKILIV